MKTHNNPKSNTGLKHPHRSGKRERREKVSAREVGAHCDDFFRRNGMDVSHTAWGKAKPEKEKE